MYKPVAIAEISHVITQTFSNIHNITYIKAYLPILGYISADSGMFRVLKQWDIFIYIKAYSEHMAYSGIFRTIDIFSQFQARYSGVTQEQFMHILNLILADSGIFRTLTYLGT